MNVTCVEHKMSPSIKFLKLYSQFFMEAENFIFQTGEALGEFFFKL